MPGCGARLQWDGLRAWKQNSAGTRIYYLYDGSLPVCELGSSGQAQGESMFGPNGLVSYNDGSHGTLFYAFDERGNTAERVATTGGLVSTDTYDAFGQRLSSTSSGGSYVDAYGYGGQAGYRTDGETGLSLLTHRYYDPAAGRFVTRDPIGYAGGINLYSYTQNNPGNWIDPDGTDTTDTIIMETSTGIGILTGGIIGGGGGGIAGAGVGAIPGAYAGAAVGGAAGVVVGGLAVGLRHALMNMYSGGGGGIEAGPGEAGSSEEDEPLKNFYNGPRDAPGYPKGFQPRSGPRRITKNPIKNPDLLSKLRVKEPGQWQKVYHDGYDASGNKISQHYCESRSGKVFDFGVSPGWSN